MVFSSLTKHCPNVLSVVLCFSAIKTLDYRQDFHFLSKQGSAKCHSVDKTLEQRFLKKFKAMCNKSGKLELRQQNVI